MIALIDYGAGNLRSVEFALEHLGVRWSRIRDPASLSGASAIILPGVGAAASAMRELDDRDLTDALRQVTVPLLGICLGMQLLTEESAEGDTPVECLGFVPGETRRFGSDGELFPLPLPHIGWNETELSDDPLFEGLPPLEHFYFLHSYRVMAPDERVIAQTEYGEMFPAAVRNGDAVAVQFHPEKSGPAGLRVLANFCRQGGAL